MILSSKLSFLSDISYCILLEFDIEILCCDNFVLIDDVCLVKSNTR